MNAKIELLKYLTYVPFIGWMLPLGFLYKDKDLMAHIKNAIVLAVFFAGLLIMFSFSSIYIYEDYRITKFVLIIISLVFYCAYLILSIIGTVLLTKNKKFEIPIVKNLAEKLNI